MLLLSLISFYAHATTYYVSEKGASNNKGTSIGTPWNYQRLQAEISKKKGNLFYAGDSILLQRGSTFYGPLQVRCSGAPGRSITIGAYGSGPKPLITGLVTLKEWKAVGAKQYTASLPEDFPSYCPILLINGKPFGQGRFPNNTDPNKGYLSNESDRNDNSSFINRSLRAGNTDWTGATLVARLMRFVIDTAVVTNQQGTELQTKNFENKAQKGFGFFLTNHPATIDSHGEWFINYASKTVRLQVDANPANYRIQVPVVDTLFNCTNQKYLVVQDLAFEGATTFGIFLAYAPNNTIQRCTVRACGMEGIAAASPGNNFISLMDNDIADCGNIGISARFVQSGLSIRGNTIQRIGLQEQYGGYGTVCRIGILNDRGEDHEIAYNRIDSTGNIGIRFKGSDVRIHHNLVQHYGAVMDDVGGIYTVNQGRQPQTNRKVYRNIILDGMDATAGTPNNTSQTYGIYIDDGSRDIELYENFIANGEGAGFYLHNTTAINIHHNTVFGFKEAGVRFTYDLAKWDPPRDIRFAHNIVVANNTTSNLVKLLETRDSTFIPAQGLLPTANKSLIDSNLYARPYREAGEKVFVGWNMYQKGKQQTRKYSLRQYNAIYGLDGNSREGAVQLASNKISDQDFLVLYNAATQTKAINLNGAYQDASGKVYGPGKINLEAFAGMVLIRAGQGKPGTANRR
ncbi:hypothetical protein BUE76_13610 [Cnuella takakiae]|nr:hypothetical protein BUE76_13610 [Cnuella takakiae]